jgi:2-C-methyl-D-erythritol 2,4-cyclodiphosphate synthase
MRIGIGFDIHRLEPGDGVILGGITIPFEKRLVGHSDADALCHAIIDALLGAAALGDIGQHFPDTDPAYKNASSIGLLEEIVSKIHSSGFRIGNVDAVVIAEAPRLSGHIAAIRERLSRTLKVDLRQVSVKSKTAERLGPIGAGEAISVQAVALLEEAP